MSKKEHNVFRERVNAMLAEYALDPKFLPPDLWTYEVYPHTIREVLPMDKSGKKEVYSKDGYLTCIFCNGMIRIKHFFTSERDAKDYGERIAQKGF